MKAIARIALGVIVLLLLLLLFAPILSAFLVLDSISLHPVDSLQKAQLYYSAVSSIVAVLVGTSGLFAGFYYFEKNHSRSAFDMFAGKIERVDFQVRRVLEKLIENPKELKEVRLNLGILFEDIVAILDEAKCPIENEEDKKKILGLYRFVDKSDVISHLEYDQLKDHDVNNVYGNYIIAVSAAKAICRKCRP